jgi:hypothetical protein
MDRMSVDSDVGKIRAVSINASGRVVVGTPASENSFIGVICPVRPMAAAEPIDVMTSGEIVECLKTAGTAFAAGDIVTAAQATGDVGATAVGAGFKAIGHMVEADRMIVRCPIPTVA